MAEPNTSPTGSAGMGTRSTDATTQPQQTAPPGGQQSQGDGGIVNRVKESAVAQVSTQKDRGTDALGSVAQAVRSSTQRLRDEKHDTIAGYVDKAADQIENWSRRLKEKDVNELVTDVQRLARRQPAVFIGSAFALGLVGARFLKSSNQQNDYGSEYRRGMYGGGRSMGTAADESGRSRGAQGDAGIDIGAASISDVGARNDLPMGTDTANRTAQGRRPTSRTGRT